MFILASKMSMFLLSKTWETLSVTHLSSDEAISNPPDSSRIGHVITVIKNAVIDRLTNNLARSRTLEKLLTAPVPPIKIEIKSSVNTTSTSRCSSNAELTAVPRRLQACPPRDFSTTDATCRPPSRP